MNALGSALWPESSCYGAGSTPLELQMKVLAQTYRAMMGVWGPALASNYAPCQMTQTNASPAKLAPGYLNVMLDIELGIWQP